MEMTVDDFLSHENYSKKAVILELTEMYYSSHYMMSTEIMRISTISKHWNRNVEEGVVQSTASKLFNILMLHHLLASICYRKSHAQFCSNKKG